jgi:hypothetical protein
VIKGSEVITNWVKVQVDIWQAKLPNSVFGNFNPYSNLINGDWFNGKDRKHQPGRNFISVCGFIMKDAATPWASPTTEQIDLIGTNWIKGYIIENNIISHSPFVQG